MIVYELVLLVSYRISPGSYSLTNINCFLQFVLLYSIAPSSLILQSVISRQSKTPQTSD